MRPLATLLLLATTAAADTCTAKQYAAGQCMKLVVMEEKAKSQGAVCLVRSSLALPLTVIPLSPHDASPRCAAGREPRRVLLASGHQ